MAQLGNYKFGDKLTKKAKQYEKDMLLKKVRKSAKGKMTPMKSQYKFGPDVTKKIKQLENKLASKDKSLFRSILNKFKK